MSQDQKPYAGRSIPENYERHLVPLLFRDYAADLVARIPAPVNGTPATLLETACGTGAVTRLLRARLGADVRITVTDLAPAMVDQARRIAGDHPATVYRQADAAELPFPGSSFDAIICQFSLMLFPDKAKAISEAARVLKPGGSFVFNVWDRLDRNVFSHVVHEAMAELYPADPPRFLEAPFSWYDLSTITDTLQQAGFGTIDVVVQPRTSRASGPRQVAAGLVMGTPLATQVAERGTLSEEEATQAVEGVIARDFGSGPIGAPMQAFQITAHLDC